MFRHCMLFEKRGPCVSSTVVNDKKFEPRTSVDHVSELTEGVKHELGELNTLEIGE